MYKERDYRKWSIEYFSVNFSYELNRSIVLFVRYVENHNCNSTASATALQEAKLSFPSGHSSYSTYAFVFLFVSKITVSVKRNFDFSPGLFRSSFGLSTYSISQTIPSMHMYRRCLFYLSITSDRL